MYSQTSLNSHGALDLSLVKCEVCGALARGKHYSVFSCDGCKGFFRRYYNKENDFSCENGKFKKILVPIFSLVLKQEKSELKFLIKWNLYMDS